MAKRKGSIIDLKSRVAQLVKQHGGVRAAGRAILVDPTYLSRIASGGKINPSDEDRKSVV